MPLTVMSACKARGKHHCCRVNADVKPKVYAQGLRPQAGSHKEYAPLAVRRRESGEQVRNFPALISGSTLVQLFYVGSKVALDLNQILYYMFSPTSIACFHIRLIFQKLGKLINPKGPMGTTRL